MLTVHFFISHLHTYTFKCASRFILIMIRLYLLEALDSSMTIDSQVTFIISTFQVLFTTQLSSRARHCQLVNLSDYNLVNDVCKLFTPNICACTAQHLMIERSLLKK